MYSTIMKVFGFAICIGLSAIAPAAFADDCGSDDRVAVPKCVYYGILIADPWVKNGCSHPVTLKWDQSGSDHRQTFQPGEYETVTVMVT